MTPPQLDLASSQQELENIRAQDASQISNAKAVLEDYAHQPLVAIGEAIGVLKEQFGTYQDLAQEVGVSRDKINKYHRVSKLPQGIRWKIEQRELSLGHAVQICRLKEENDQWLLAFAIVDAAEKEEAVTQQECKQIVDEVLRGGKPMREALSQRFGFNFDESVPLILSFDYWFRLKLCRSAWNREKNWADLVYDIINEWLDGREFSSTADLKGISRELIDAASRLEELAE